MTKQLKCWKKMSDVGWQNKKSKEFVTIANFPTTGRRGTITKGWRVFSDNEKGFLEVKKGIKGRNKALKFAKSYMKKHDKC